METGLEPRSAKLHWEISYRTAWNVTSIRMPPELEAGSPAASEQPGC